MAKQHGFKLNIKAGQVCPIEGCGMTLTNDDIREARLNNWDGCALCFEEAGLENEHQDGYHDEDSNGARDDCPMCPIYSNPRTLPSSLERAKKNKCRCGCGQPVAKEYKQGHDARHVSILVADAIAGRIKVADGYAALGSPNLQTKFERAYNRAMDEAKAKANRAAAKAERKAELVERKANAKAAVKGTNIKPTFTEVKVGRWWYPTTQVVHTGVDTYAVTYTNKQGGIETIEVAKDKLR